MRGRAGGVRWVLTSIARRRAGLLLLAIALLCAGGCQAPVEEGAPTAVSPVLLSFLSRARSAHHAADIHVDSNELGKAVEVLDKLTQEAKPKVGADGEAPAEVKEVLADTRARLADLRSRQGRFDAANVDIDAGLKLVADVSYFRGHLFEMRGVVEQRRAKKLTQDGNADAAKEAKQRALVAFEKSMAINLKVIEQALPAEEPAQ